MIRSKKIKEAARGEECTLRLVGVCNFNPETTILAHIGRDRGIGLKCDDSFSVFACSNCHTEIDGPYRFNYAQDKLDALERTQKILFEKGLLKI